MFNLSTIKTISSNLITTQRLRNLHMAVTIRQRNETKNISKGKKSNETQLQEEIGTLCYVEGETVAQRCPLSETLLIELRDTDRHFSRDFLDQDQSGLLEYWKGCSIAKRSKEKSKRKIRVDGGIHAFEELLRLCRIKPIPS